MAKEIGANNKGPSKRGQKIEWQSKVGPKIRFPICKIVAHVVGVAIGLELHWYGLTIS
jgi:hypothetical protein